MCGSRAKCSLLPSPRERLPGVVAPPEQDALQVAELVEEEERVVGGTAEVAVVGAALLMALGLADGAGPVQDELLELAVLMGLADPLAREVHQVLEVVLGAEGLGLEAGHLAGGSRLEVLGPATHHRPEGGI